MPLSLLVQEAFQARSMGALKGTHHTLSPAGSTPMLQPSKQSHYVMTQHNQSSSTQKTSNCGTYGAPMAADEPSASQPHDCTTNAQGATGRVENGVSETVGQVQQLLAAARDNPALAGLIQSAAEQHGMSMDSIASITQQLPQQQLPMSAPPSAGVRRPSQVLMIELSPSRRGPSSCDLNQQQHCRGWDSSSQCMPPLLGWRCPLRSTGHFHFILLEQNR